MRPLATEPIVRMVSAMHHRGPDDHGYLTVETEPYTQIANTRLAILDLSPAGHQPMRDPATGNAVVLNGEIYNHLDVRREIGDRASEWKSSSDTETVLKAWTLWGPDCLQRLRGMFAIAFWDCNARKLWCARDRLGIKPFYYYSAGGSFLFASEVRALLASGLIPRAIDPAGLSGFVRFGSLIEPHTMISGIQSLPAGTFMSVNNAEPDSAQPYWHLPRELKSVSREEATGQVREHLERSVREHLLADVPVGCFLSGGIDSSVTTALAARTSPCPVRTFTVAFPDTAIDESGHAALVAARYSTEHYPIVLSREDVIGMMPDAVRSMDLPSADAVNTYIVSRAAASTGTKVVLSGLGGDELFGGYRSFRILDRAHRFAGIAAPFRSALATTLRLKNGARERFVEMLKGDANLADRYDTLRSYWSRSELRQMIAESAGGYGIGMDNSMSGGIPSQVSALELQGYMRNTLLRDSDFMSMASSLELRVPFLDHLLVEHALRVNAAAFGVKYGRKELLLRACGDLLPRELLSLPKQGFTLPMADWMRGPLREFVVDGLNSLDLRRVFPRLDFRLLADRFESGALPWARLWQFSVLGHWLEPLNLSLNHELHEPAGLSLVS